MLFFAILKNKLNALVLEFSWKIPARVESSLSRTSHHQIQNVFLPPHIAARGVGRSPGPVVIGGQLLVVAHVLWESQGDMHLTGHCSQRVGSPRPTSTQQLLSCGLLLRYCQHSLLVATRVTKMSWVMWWLLFFKADYAPIHLDLSLEWMFWVRSSEAKE